MSASNSRLIAGVGLLGISAVTHFLLSRITRGSRRGFASARDVISRMENRLQLDEGKRGIGEIVIKNELYAAAETLLEARSVAIITGFPCLIDFDPPTETDGPLGALAIARALIALKKNVVIATDECNAEPMLAAARASGLYGPQLRLECFAGGLEFDASEHRRLKDLARSIDTVVAIERAGPSPDGSYRTMRGRDMTPIVAPLELLINGGEDFDDNDEYEQEGSPIRAGGSGDIGSPSAVSKSLPSPSTPRPRSIGIGDGGNEVGMGKILDTILQSSIPNASSIACIVPTDHLIVASVSNWGGYGLAAAVAVLCASSAAFKGNTPGAGSEEERRRAAVSACLVTSEQEARICEALVGAGARDGISRAQELSVDGMPLASSLTVLEDLRRLALSGDPAST